MKYGRALGLGLRAARESKGLSGGQLSKLSGVDVDAIRRIELGKVASPGFALIASLRGPLGLSLDVLADDLDHGSVSP